MATPHDRLFKATFSQLEHARSELEAVLPAELVAHVDWSTLSLVSGKFVDAALGQRESDLLFTARLGSDLACIYVLFEHQSTADPTMAFRLLRYMTRIWERFSADHRNDRLPVIIPVVLHHGHSGWTAPTRFSELVGIPTDLRDALAAFIPDFTFVVDDLAKLDDAAFRHRALTALARLTLVVLQRCREAVDPLSVLRPWRDVAVGVLTAVNGVEAFSMILRYIAEVGETPLEELWAFVEQLGPGAEEAIVTTAEQIAAQARIEGSALTVLKQLKLKFGQLDERVTHRVQSASTEQLDVWTERVLTAASLAEVFGP